jgi:hypothetical protein
MIKPLNLNIDHWSMLEAVDSSVLDFSNQDISALVDYISDTNINDEVPWNYDAFMSVAKNGSRVMS